MKKALLFLFSIFLISGCVQSSDKISNTNSFLTLFSSQSKSENKVWIGTFQLVFNDMKNKVLKSDIYFENEEPTPELKGLNNEEFNSDMLNESSYYTSYGETSLEAKNKIKKDIKQKFNETSDIIDDLDWSKGKGKYYAYAMLKKEFEFLKEFDKLENGSFNNSSEEYRYFGIKTDSDELLHKNVHILFYNNQNDYAVSLLTKTNDIVYLYRTDKNDTLKNLWGEMLDKQSKYKGLTHFADIDTLKVPDMKFETIKRYPELCNKKIIGKDLVFSEALETLKFELNNKGGKVKSEAILMTDNAMIPMGEQPKPRHFNFDKTFAMFLVDSDKTEPYMALRVYDLKEFQN